MDLPQVPVFGSSAVTPGAADQKAKTRVETREEKRQLAEEERRQKAGSPDLARNPPRMVMPTPRGPDCVGAGADEARRAMAQTAMASIQASASSTSDGAQPDDREPGQPAEPLAASDVDSLLKTVAVGTGEPRSGRAGVYGFAGAAPKVAQGASKAIVLRLEPLKPGLPEFERVLGEHKQNIVIGSQRRVADVIVGDEAISKRHAVIELIGIKGELGLSISDHSTNGTFVNKARLQPKNKRFRIRSGDVLHLMDPSIDDEFGWKVDFGNTVAYFSR